MAGLLDNPVITGLLSAGPERVRAMANQQVASMLPRGGGGMIGAPGAIVRSGGGLADIGQGFAGLGQGLAAIGQMRKQAQRQEQIEGMIANLPPEQQDMARANPDLFYQAKIKEAFDKPQLTKENTALFNVDGQPRRMTLEAGMKEGLPEWQDPPEMKTFGNDVVGYYGLTRDQSGKTVQIPLVPGLGRDPKTPTYKIAETADGVFAIDSANPENRIRVGDPTIKPQDELARVKLDEMQETTSRQAVNHFEDISKTIRQAELVLNHPGREAGTGLSSWQSLVPGSDARGFASQLETLKSQVFLPEVQKMQGMGALSNAEGQKISAAFAALDPDMPEAEFKSTLERAIGDLRAAQERARARLPNDYEPYNPDGRGLSVVVNPSGVLTPEREGELKSKYGF